MKTITIDLDWLESSIAQAEKPRNEGSTGAAFSEGWAKALHHVLSHTVERTIEYEDVIKHIVEAVLHEVKNCPWEHATEETSEIRSYMDSLEESVRDKVNAELSLDDEPLDLELPSSLRPTFEQIFKNIKP